MRKPKSILVKEERTRVNAALKHNPNSRKTPRAQANLLQRQTALDAADAVLITPAEEEPEEHVMLNLAVTHLDHETATEDAKAADTAQLALSVRLRDGGPSSMGLGARVVICTDHADTVAQGPCQMRLINAGGGFMALDPILARFSLSDARTVSLIPVE